MKIIPPDNKRTKCEVYSRVCGYIRPTSNWAEHKQEEFKDRKEYDKCLTKEKNEEKNS